MRSLIVTELKAVGGGLGEDFGFPGGLDFGFDNDWADLKPTPKVPKLPKAPPAPGLPASVPATSATTTNVNTTTTNNNNNCTGSVTTKTVSVGWGIHVSSETTCTK